MRDKKKGFISFVSAGVSHPSLLTIKGKARIDKADVILYDALISPSYPSIFPKKCSAFFVGKRANQHCQSQEEINKLLIRYALIGKRVVRLKGGDASIFGRLMEEIEAIEPFKIHYEIIPGVSSLTAGINQLGLGLTHRKYLSDVLVLNGHNLRKKSEVYWRFLANFQGAIVLMMAFKVLEEISKNFIRYGYNPHKLIIAVKSAGASDSKVQFFPINKTKDFVKGQSFDKPYIFYLNIKKKIVDFFRFFEN